jgi:hypothetical protein
MEYLDFDCFAAWDMGKFLTEEEKTNIVKEYNLISDFGIGVDNEKSIDSVKEIFFDLMLKGINFEYFDKEKDIFIDTLSDDKENLTDCKGYVRYTGQGEDNFEEDEDYGLNFLRLLRGQDCVDRVGKIKTQIVNNKDLKLIPFFSYSISSKDMKRFEKDYAEKIESANNFRRDKFEIYSNGKLSIHTKKKLLRELETKYRINNKEEI